MSSARDFPRRTRTARTATERPARTTAPTPTPAAIATVPELSPALVEACVSGNWPGRTVGDAVTGALVEGGAALEGGVVGLVIVGELVGELVVGELVMGAGAAVLGAGVGCTVGPEVPSRTENAGSAAKSSTSVSLCVQRPGSEMAASSSSRDAAVGPL